jgi:ABC-type phosphate transport system permease subunit
MEAVSGNAIVGTLVIVAIATVISVPLGILGAVYIADFGADSKIAKAVQFAAKVLTGLPSILAGVFAFATVVVVTGGFSAPAGGAALALLMLPTIMLTAEEAIKRVPSRMREAAIGMGATPTQVVARVILPTAFPGNPDRSHAGARAGSRRNGAVAVHLALQRILDQSNSAVFPAQDCGRPDEADCFVGRSDL